MGLNWGVVFSIAICIGIIPATIAHNSGRKFILWYIYGVLFFALAMIHIIFLETKDKNAKASIIIGASGLVLLWLFPFLFLIIFGIGVLLGIKGLKSIGSRMGAIAGIAISSIGFLFCLYLTVMSILYFSPVYNF